MKASEFVDEVRMWEGVKFQHQGRGPMGVDCIGLAVVTLKAKGYLPTDFSDNASYGRSPNTSEFIDTVGKFCTRIDKLEHGCLVVFKWPSAKYPSHAGVYDATPTGYIIHAYELKRRVIKMSYGQPWVRMTDSFWRLPGIEAPA